MSSVKSTMAYSPAPGRVSVTEQPQRYGDIYPIDPKYPTGVECFDSEKIRNGDAVSHNPSCDCHRQTPSPDHRHCHNGRLRRFLIPALIAFVLLGGLFTFGCMGDYSLSGWGTAGDNLVSRALSDSTTNNGTGGSFVHRKLYLIVVFVGLVLVVILGIMLAAWCCRGSFENPLCCPCYLCACCGGLACLECIACGLCAEGVEQM